MTNHFTTDNKRTLCGLDLTVERWRHLHTTKDREFLNCGRCERAIAKAERAQ